MTVAEKVILYTTIKAFQKHFFNFLLLRKTNNILGRIKNVCSVKISVICDSSVTSLILKFYIYKFECLKKVVLK